MLFRYSLTFIVFLSFTTLADNDKIKIVGQRELKVTEGNSITITLNDLKVEADEDLNYPQGFHVQIDDGENYSVSNQTITPNAGFTGTLTARVRVANGKNKSQKYPITIEVVAATKDPENVPPVITGQVVLTVNKNTPITIKPDHLIVSDPDDDYPSGFTLRVIDGEWFSVNGNIVTPDAGYVGVITVPVTVHDGKDESERFGLKITVVDNAPANIRPVITGQVDLHVDKNESIEITLAHLTVEDADDNYPSGFSLKILDGPSYSVNGTTVTPDDGFVGILSIPVTINDGKQDSDVFNLKVTVSDAVHNNIPPVITGQTGLTTFKNEPIRIRLSHVSVDDPDNPFPTGFTLKLFPGSNYSVSESLVTPAAGFLGTLVVVIKVSDGISDSEPFELRINVVEKGSLQIVGQVPLQIEEDSSFTIQLRHLVVNDPTGKFPEGFNVAAGTGDHYTVEDGKINPLLNYNGPLRVPVSVTDGTSTSDPYELLIVVKAVNDAPTFQIFDVSELRYSAEENGIAIAQEVVIEDVDDQSLSYAEVGFIQGFNRAFDRLTAAGTDSITSLYDENTGVLLMIGQASLREYANVLKSIYYQNDHQNDTTNQKTMYFKLNDGKAFSDVFIKIVSFNRSSGEISIPAGFTPNNDNANDTWIVGDNNTDYDEVEISVFNTKGLLVFRSSSFDVAWDGKYSGELLPAGSYFYTVTIKFREQLKLFKGVVTILR
jgi:gliding motility-associated-like protein